MDFLKIRNISNNKIYEQAKNLDIGIVLTAHPTEVKRRTLIQKYANLIKSDGKKTSCIKNTHQKLLK